MKISLNKYMKNYSLEIGGNNLEKARELNNKYNKTYYKNHNEKIKQNSRKYNKLKFHCLFCNKSSLYKHKKRHNNSQLHKKNIIKFNKLLIK